MYKVFVNERPLILTNKVEKEQNNKLFLLETAPVIEIVKEMYRGRLNEVHLYHPREDQLIKKLSKHLPIVIAGGGVVKNDKGETLFIYRNNKWDLPKGKVDKGETIREAAIREVEEETNVKGIKIIDFLQTTYHVFKRNNVYKLKETHWYNMYTSYSGLLSGQEDEGITKVEWKNEVAIQEALKNSYKNIQLFFED